MLRYHYLTSCVDCRDVYALDQMIEQGRKIGKKRFWEMVGRDQLEELFPDYAWAGRGLKMWDDWHIAYFRSTFSHKPCLYLVHSAIEYIFIGENDGT